MELNSTPCFLLVVKREGDADTTLLIFEAVEDAQLHAQYLISEQNHSTEELKLLQTVIYKAGVFSDGEASEG